MSSLTRIKTAVFAFINYIDYTFSAGSGLPTDISTGKQTSVKAFQPVASTSMTTPGTAAKTDICTII